MIELRLNEVLEEQGITNKSTAAKEVGMSRSPFNRMTVRNPVRIELETIEKLCRAFNITPSELFAITNEDGTPWKPSKR